MEKYFTETILEKIDNIPNLYIAYFLFEGAVYSLVKRREPYKKTYFKDPTGLDNNIYNNNSSLVHNYSSKDPSSKKAENLNKNGKF